MALNESFVPSEEILQKYAELIVKFGIQDRDGEKLKKGSVVHFRVPEVARSLYFHLQHAILKAGFHPLGEYLPSSDSTFAFKRDFLQTATPTQLEHSNEKLTRAQVETMDATILILAPSDLHETDGIADKKTSALRKSIRKGTLLRRQKIDDGKLNWVIALYGTEALAKEAGMSLKQYWNQIIKACYLDESNPVSEWKKLNRATMRIAKKLSDMEIESLHMVGQDADIKIGIGKDRQWLAGGGCNIPSYEVFTSPRWQDINGWIRFNQPLYRDGKKIEDITLTIKDGVVTKATASKNQTYLKQLLKEKNADKIGEFSLTDGRHSRITKFMAETLYDENIGGKYGNTHLAVGTSFRDCYKGKPNPKWKTKDWQAKGFNHSVVHTDIISTADRTVTATLQDGSTKVIYEDGKFVI